MTATKETLGFQAEVKQLLHLMVHSLYGNKEIFLRELMSNASDAGDKLRFEAIADAALFENDRELKIRVSYDRQARTITVSDNGIGMSRQEVIDHIGTIAKSGTREFFERLTSDPAKDAQLIGQFGVGFYSSFIVADRVTLITRRAGLDRRTRRALGERRRGRLHHRDRRQGDARHRRRRCTCGRKRTSCCPARACARSCASTPTTSRVPILMKKEQWDADAREAGDDRRGRADQPGLGAVGAAEVGDHRGAVPRVLQARRARFRAAARLHATRRSRAGRSTRSCSSSRSGRRSTSGIASIGTASSSTSAASSSWTMPSSCCRRTCGSCAASSTRAICR